MTMTILWRDTLLGVDIGVNQFLFLVPLWLSEVKDQVEAVPVLIIEVHPPDTVGQPYPGEGHPQHLIPVLQLCEHRHQCDDH